MGLFTDRTIATWVAKHVISAGVCCVVWFSLCVSIGAQHIDGGEHWVGTWATVPVARCPGRSAGQAPPPHSRECEPVEGNVMPDADVPSSRAPLPILKNQTLRQIVRISLGGEQVRVVLTNAYGTVPLMIGAAHVALRANDERVNSSSIHQLTFSGRSAMPIPPGAVLVSDPVSLMVEDSADLAIDVYLPGDVAATASPMTVHSGTGGLQTNFISSEGNYSGNPELPIEATTVAWFFLTRVEVAAAEGAGAIVALGDSITDGSQSTPDTNSRWPNQLAQRLEEQGIKMGVLNAGFSGNRILDDGSNVNALARFDRDVLVPQGVTHVIVMDGINDIGQAGEESSPTADDIIAGHQQLIQRAHAHGIKVYGATLTPFEGARYWTREGEAKRQALNEWIRSSGAYDAVLDFDAAVRDPNNPTKYQQRYDPGDHLHPNDAGYRALADSIDLDLFRSAAKVE